MRLGEASQPAQQRFGEATTERRTSALPEVNQVIVGEAGVVELVHREPIEAHKSQNATPLVCAPRSVVLRFLRMRGRRKRGRTERLATSRPASYDPTGVEP